MAAIVLQTEIELKTFIKKVKNKGLNIGFVPTMGCLHEGHLDLVQASKNKSDITIVSIYVNPTQFGKNEDFSSYPSPLKADIELCNQRGVDAIFIPSTKLLYPEKLSYSTQIIVPTISKKLCGKTRKNFFRGVCMVVLRLFNLVQPDQAYFGEKDYQQLFIIKKMVRDLFLNIEILGCPTRREASGLALSSRNKYLSTNEKEKASSIHASFKKISSLISTEIYDSEILIKSVESIILDSGIDIDYFEILNQQSFRKSKIVTTESRVFFGGYMGKTRLIDNFSLSTSF
ncbi:pantoate--beta-alanine ligase [bacterium]|mgnify:CR=1 FL=1|jgi:pantoate--beta-alanine ligase|nr:pantoate--beta-alanine ligase [bacterium]